ncbi:MAG: CPBP family intramembrane glutamic endopeptidase [Armatimonadota bacterium]
MIIFHLFNYQHLLMLFYTQGDSNDVSSFELIKTTGIVIIASIFISCGLRGAIWKEKPALGFPINHNGAQQFGIGLLSGFVIGTAFFLSFWKQISFYPHLPASIICALTFTFTAAIIEECIFRGRLLEMLEKKKTANKALFLQAIIFTLVRLVAIGINGAPTNLFALPCIGLILGWMRQKTGNLWMSTGADMIINTMLMCDILYNLYN